MTFYQELGMGLGQVVIQDSFGSPRHNSPKPEQGSQPMPAELLDMFDEMDRQYIEELDRMARLAQNQQIAAASDESLQFQLQMSAWEDRIAHYGEANKDRAVIAATLRQQYYERVQRMQAAADARARREAEQRAETARLEAWKREIIAELLALKADVSKMMTSSDMQYLRDHALALQIDAQEAVINAEKAAERARESATKAGRLVRAVKVVGGAVEATVGALACPTTGFGCAMAAHGVDTFVAGVRGERSLTAQFGTLVTGSERGGDYVDAFAGLVLSFGVSEASLVNLAGNIAPEATALGTAGKLLTPPSPPPPPPPRVIKGSDPSSSPLRARSFQNDPIEVSGQETRVADAAEVRRYELGMRRGGVEVAYTTYNDGTNPKPRTGDQGSVEIPRGPGAITTWHSHPEGPAIFSGGDIATYFEGPFAPGVTHSVTGEKWAMANQVLRQAPRIEAAEGLVTTSASGSLITSGAARPHDAWNKIQEILAYIRKLEDRGAYGP